MSNGSKTPAQIWTQVTDRIKHQIVQPNLWRSMEAGVPITVDEGRLVLGYDPSIYHLSGNLLMSQNLNAIQRALTEVVGEKTELKIIEGSSMDDWGASKTREAETKKLSEVAYAKARKQTTQEHGWDGLMESVQRKFAATANRQFPQSRAHYVEEMIKQTVVEAEKLMSDRPDLDEINQRQLARVIEKIAALAGVPSVYVAMELDKLQESLKG